MSASVFPARAGMSPRHGYAEPAHPGVPRASGDEPEEIITGDVMTPCSPRERG